MCKRELGSKSEEGGKGHKETRGRTRARQILVGHDVMSRLCCDHYQIVICIYVVCCVFNWKVWRISGSELVGEDEARYYGKGRCT